MLFPKMEVVNNFARAFSLALGIKKLAVAQGAIEFKFAIDILIVIH